MNLSRLTAASDVTTRKRQQGTATRYNAMRATNVVPAGAIPPSDLYDIGHTVARYNDQKIPCTVCSNEDIAFSLDAHNIVVGGAVVNLTIAPGNPNNLLATTLGLGSIQFTFSPPTTGDEPTSYTYIYTDGISQASTVGSILYPTTTFTLTSRIPSNSYTLILRAVNSGGVSSGVTLVGVVSNVPNQPVLGTPIHGNQSITVPLSGAQVDGGATIDKYAYSTSIGGPYTDINQTTGPFFVTSLTNGTPYTIYIKAHNINGYSTPSSAGPTTPSTVPGAPILGTPTYGINSVTIPLTFQDDGGASPITYAYSTGGGFTPISLSAGSFAISIAAGSYTITIQAQNINGSASTSISVTIPSGPSTPSPPSVNRNLATGTELTFSWNAPYDGGSPITQYILFLSDGSALITTGASTTSHTYVGLVPDTFYTAAVRAVNAYGLSAFSGSSTSLQPGFPSAAPSPPSVTITTLFIPPIINRRRITWSAVGSTFPGQVTGYMLRLNTDQGTNKTVGPITGTQFDLTQYASGDSELIVSTTYRIAVSTRGICGDSPFSSPDTVFGT